MAFGRHQSLISSFIVAFLFFLSVVHAADPVPTDEENISSPLTDGCPKLCQDVGYDPSKWTEIHSRGELSNCAVPLLFDLNVQNPPSEFATMQTCAKYSPPSPIRREAGNILSARASDPIVVDSNCGAESSSMKTSVSFSASKIVGAGSDAAAAAQMLAQYLDDGAVCGQTILFAKSGSAVVGMYVGAEVQKTSASTLINQSRSYPSSQDCLAFLLGGVARFRSGAQVMQICDSNNKKSQTVGLFAVNSVKDFSKAHKAVQTWVKGKCVDIQGKSSENFNLGVLVPPQSQKRDVELRSRFTGVENLLTPRADCKAIQVQSGDSCSSLATRCKITSANLTKYNTKTNFCSSLVPNQWICCSSGTLPDVRPKPQKDGTCAIYAIKSGDSCDSLGLSYGITANYIRDVNKNTWGWAGCYRLEIGQRICLSTGKAPMPKAVAGAVCGPQKPGSMKPSSAKNGWDLVNMNPCPLKACCSGFGFCGITSEFCTNTTATGGAPGTYKAGTAGCVSNCGTKITGNTNKPASFLNVGYFQAYNNERPCLNMDVTKLAQVKTSYTHMHFAFAGLAADLSVSMGSDVQKQFDKFVGMKGTWKKIVSFGGWAESTDAATFQRYRDAMKSANREKFANTVIAFLNKYKLDGVDFDWEYPGATPNPGSSESTDDASNYVQFLTLMRSKLGKNGKTMSVALPAAYWYLKPFAVDKMGALVDYIVYMTYDLHGQWDYGNPYASSGCPNGNCLRSHVNKTETADALAMITKAGVPASKIVVGVSSYGRSFRMANSGCTGPTCTFTGSFSQSDAEPGICTNYGGYLANAEITKIIADAKAGKKGVTAYTWYDSKSDSDLMTYSTKGEGNVNWVAYMSDATKKRRTDYIKSLNFAGTIDWAVDLQEWFSPQPTGSVL